MTVNGGSAIRASLAAAIRESGLSAFELSEAAGVRRQAIERLLRGDDIKIVAADRLADYFGMSIQFLAAGNIPTSPHDAFTPHPDEPPRLRCVSPGGNGAKDDDKLDGDC